MLVATPDPNISQILNSYILHNTALPSPNTNSNVVHQEKIKHLHYLNDFRTQQCPLFLDHKCQSHRPFACFHWHFPNQRRRRPVKKSDGTFNYNPDVYCTSYDENTGVCPNGDDCQYVHRNAGDTERRYHPRYYKTGQCIYETADNGQCVKNGQHCAFAHGIDDLRQPVYDIREVNDAAEHITNLPATLEKERVLSEDPKWNDMLYVLAFYKTTMCKKPPRMCRQGYACPYYHNGKDRRRNPHSYRYRSTPCPQVKPSGDDWRDSSQCDGGDECAYCHTRTEQQFHPEIYKSTKCNDMIHEGFCPRGPFCAFAHGEGEANIGRDFLATPGLIEDLHRRHDNSSIDSNTSNFKEDSSKVDSDDGSNEDGNQNNNTNNLFNAGISKSQLGIGMVGLSGLNSGTINYLQSLLSTQTQVIHQFHASSSGESDDVITVKSNDDSNNHNNNNPSNFINNNNANNKPLSPSTPTTINNKLLQISACSSDSGLSTTREDVPISATLNNIMNNSALNALSSSNNNNNNALLQALPEKDENSYSKYPYLNMILGSVLEDSFNTVGNLELENDDLHDSQLDEIVITAQSMVVGASSVDEIVEVDEELEDEHTNLSMHNYVHGAVAVGSERRRKRLDDDEDDMIGLDNDDVDDSQGGMGCIGLRKSAPLSIPSSSTRRPVHFLSQTVNNQHQYSHHYNPQGWSTGYTSSGASSGLGDSAPTTTSHLAANVTNSGGSMLPMRQGLISRTRGVPISKSTGANNTLACSSSPPGRNIAGRPITNNSGNMGTSPTTTTTTSQFGGSSSLSHLPQSPIMIQSPFQNAACDLEKLVMERELCDVKGKLCETEKELTSMRHQRDVVLLQLEESWKLIQSLVGSPANGNSVSDTSQLQPQDDKENKQQNPVISSSSITNTPGLSNTPSPVNSNNSSSKLSNHFINSNGAPNKNIQT